MSIFAMQADAAKVKVQHVHPLCWWAGMKNPELQILIHGEGVGTQQVALKDAQGIEIKEVVTQENPNYLILFRHEECTSSEVYHQSGTPVYTL